MRRTTVALLWTIELAWWTAVALALAGVVWSIPLGLLAMMLSLGLDPNERGRPMRRR